MAAVVAALALAGCGSQAVAELPAAAGPKASPPLTERPEGQVVRTSDFFTPEEGVGVPVDGGREAVVLGRERAVELRDAATGRVLGRADAGVGPTRAFSRGPWLWVVDTDGQALLVYRVRPELELVRRVHLPGGPFAITFDQARFRLWITLTGTNEVAELPPHGRPRVLRRFPTVRQPDAVLIDPDTDEVVVLGKGAQQQFTPPPPEDS